MDRFKRYIIVTGVLAGPVLERGILPKLKKIKNFEIELRVVTNAFFGESVTVSGLLTGQDIFNSLKEIGKEAIFLLPDNCVNEDGVFLDDLSPGDLSGELGRPLRIIRNFEELFSS
jgi:NifB/MoaA-like Fe-S oxidoreductase